MPEDLRFRTEKIMLKNLAFIAMAAAVAAGVGYANQSTSKVVIPIHKTWPTNGKEMFVDYCAPCHGVDGKGSGPVAAALKQPPFDLATLSKNNGGKFPAAHIQSVLQFGTSNPAHGNAEMPVWGPMFSKMNIANVQSNEMELRITNLTRYLQSIQTK